MSHDKTPRIFPLGNGALTVEFGRSISIELNERAIALANYFDSEPFEGFVESAPAYASTTIFFDVAKVRQAPGNFVTAFDAVKDIVESVLPTLGGRATVSGRPIEIPLSFAADDGPDLAIVAKFRNLTIERVIEIFTATEYRVFMIGFLPGFAYMGTVDERLAVPRKDSPRLKVRRGSVGIAGPQTGIYPFDSPGGWQIIGRTDEDLFDPTNKFPCMLQAGDTVRFTVAGR
jgi:inhibitor of KinA